MFVVPQLLSLIVSFTTTGSTVAFSDREMDLSKFRRADEPGLFGYVPKRLEGRTRQMFASVFFYAFYKASKVLSIATLASANGVVAFIYLVLGKPHKRVCANDERIEPPC